MVCVLFLRGYRDGIFGIASSLVALRGGAGRPSVAVP